MHKRNSPPALGTDSQPLPACVGQAIQAVRRNGPIPSVVNRLSHNRVPVLLTVVFASFSTGCESFNKAPNSFDRGGERVRIRMLTASQMENYGEKHLSDATKKRDYKASYEAATATTRVGTAEAVYIDLDDDLAVTEFADTAASLASAAIGAAIDYTAKELERDAERFQMQYRGVHYNDAFWSAKNTPKYQGFEIVRWTTKFPQSDGSLGSPPTASTRFVCAMVPSQHDGRVFVLRPVYLEVNSTKAKLPWIGNDKFNAEFDIQITGSVITKDALKEVLIATTKCNIGGLDIDGKATRHRTFHESVGSTSEYIDSNTAGWFMGPLLSTQRDAGGPFKIAVSVTETSDSKAPVYIERSAGYLRENKEDIQNVISSHIDGN